MALLEGILTTLAVVEGFAIVYVIADARGKRKALAAWESATDKRLGKHDEQLVTVGQALAQLVPPDARPTTAHRAALPAAPVDVPSPASTAPTALAPAVPRIRVEIRHSPFPADVYAVLARGDGQPMVLNVDARDVDVREGTMPVNVLQVRAGLVGVELPPERPRRRVVWLSQAMVLDCPDAPPPSPVALFEAEDDRGGIIPGDLIPSESTEDIRARFEAEADARSRARVGLPSTTTDDEPEDERTRVYSGKSGRRATLLGGLAGAPLEKPVSDPSRTAREYMPHKATPSSPTLVSPGVVVLGNAETAEDGSLTVEPEREDGQALSERARSDDGREVAPPVDEERGTPSPPVERSGLSPEATRRLAQLVVIHERRTGQRPDDDKLAALTAQAVRETLRK
jgi:hypothetical protein